MNPEPDARKIYYRLSKATLSGFKEYPYRLINDGGYAELWDSTSMWCVLEHRYIIEQHIGRPLRPDEHVHHKDEDKLNNNINNLEMMSPGEHCRHNAKKRYERRTFLCYA